MVNTEEKIIVYGCLALSLLCALYTITAHAVPSTNSTILVDVQTLDSLINFLSSPYTDLIGTLFNGVVMTGICVPIYIRNKNIGYMMIIGFLVFGGFEVAIPGAGINFVRILMALGAGYLIYSSYMSVKQ